MHKPTGPFIVVHLLLKRVLFVAASLLASQKLLLLRRRRRLLPIFWKLCLLPHQNPRHLWLRLSGFNAEGATSKEAQGKRRAGFGPERSPPTKMWSTVSKPWLKKQPYMVDLVHQHLNLLKEKSLSRVTQN